MHLRNTVNTYHAKKITVEQYNKVQGTDANKASRRTNLQGGQRMDH